MKKEALKKLGILGVSFGLVASPLAFAMEEHEEHPTAPQEETMQDDQGSFNSFDADQEQGATNDGVTTEYEEEEQEFTYEEEEEEQDQWETEEEDDSGW
ncbi:MULTISPECIES: hypothetical protein [Halomonadaceae]|uniref:Uncharacterized protein n=2 Tax=Halomonadaceae TaxID=28256 RepID=A0A8H9I585_9GAMM|nr:MULTISPECIES: hypothetical protein [Halomonas]ATH77586.1 hypothetical protein CLM76_08300 [Halomonas hydrothermalis]KHJ52816.1 hypothetical protein PZ78_01330 [Halomonas hydrothermalis]UDM06820.1 hypothetical protein LG409_15815 [Halomonas sp. NyZ770]GGW40819.1 hypothetical protein GCM10007157_34390 [Halomonas hamiltonii]GGW56683.1 hypothetical protein GCM10007158_17120 [Halomonas johnsoniae]